MRESKKVTRPFRGPRMNTSSDCLVIISSGKKSPFVLNIWFQVSYVHMKTTEYNLEQFLRGHWRFSEYLICEDLLVGNMVSTIFKTKTFFKKTIFTEYIHTHTEHHDIFTPVILVRIQSYSYKMWGISRCFTYSKKLFLILSKTWEICHSFALPPASLSPQSLPSILLEGDMAFLKYCHCGMREI